MQMEGASRCQNWESDGIRLFYLMFECLNQDGSCFHEDKVKGLILHGLLIIEYNKSIDTTLAFITLHKILQAFPC